MAVDDLKKIAQSMLELRRSIDNVAKALNSTNKKVDSATNFNQYINNHAEPTLDAETLFDVPVYIDWITPNIEGVAQVYKDSSGIHIQIHFDSEQEARFAGLLEDDKIELLHLSSMAP